MQTNEGIWYERAEGFIAVEIKLIYPKSNDNPARYKIAKQSWCKSKVSS